LLIVTIEGGNSLVILLKEGIVVDVLSFVFTVFQLEIN
jgi:hypothetical protein